MFFHEYERQSFVYLFAFEYPVSKPLIKMNIAFAIVPGEQFKTPLAVFSAFNISIVTHLDLALCMSTNTLL